ncbi:alpha/beta fold hydrolase [Bowmanella denitrificans]|uniref:Alpha/beta fold hydrolase n=1 Tax=Bowmanella denitrificans TaxID=366582 RepID=A0ABP3GS37_9ALTE
MDAWLLYLLILLALILAFYGSSYILLQWQVSRYYKLTGKSYAALGFVGSVLMFVQIIRTLVMLSWYLVSKNRHGLKPLYAEPGQKVLLIHGLHMNGNCFWGFREYLENAGFRTYSINLGKPYTPVERYVQRLHRILQRITGPDEKVHLVAHSMGGLVIRMLLKAHPEDEKYLASISTLGTPHKGTAIVGDFALPWLKQLFHPNSPGLKALPNLASLAPDIPLMTLGSYNDLVVYPLANAMQPKARQIKLYAMSHIGMLTEQRVHKKVCNWLLSLPQNGQNNSTQ